MTAHWIVISARHVAYIRRIYIYIYDWGGAVCGISLNVDRDANSHFSSPSSCVRYLDDDALPTRFSFVMAILSVVANLVSRA